MLTSVSTWMGGGPRKTEDCQLESVRRCRSQSVTDCRFGFTALMDVSFQKNKLQTYQIIASDIRFFRMVHELPSHAGLAGNVTVDAAVKAALTQPSRILNRISVPFSIFCSFINSHCASHL